MHHRRRRRVGLAVPAEPEIAGGMRSGTPRRARAGVARWETIGFLSDRGCERTFLCAPCRASVTASASAATAAARFPGVDHGGFAVGGSYGSPLGWMLGPTTVCARCSAARRSSSSTPGPGACGS